MLRELAELTELDEANPQSFRVRAYESAAQAIAAQATDLGKLTTKELQQIEGIGKSTADKIRELLETGRVAKLEALRQKHPPGRRRAAARCRGSGRRRSRSCAASSAWRRSTTCAARSPSTRCATSRASARSPRRSSRAALARLDAQGSVGRTPISVALPLANADRRAHARGAGRHARRRTAARCAASPRRSATSTSWSPRATPRRSWRRSSRMSVVERVLGRGESKTSVVTHRGTQIDLRVVGASTSSAPPCSTSPARRATTSSCACARSRAA